MTAPVQPRLTVLAEGSTSTGVGHLARCAALTEALVAAGAHVTAVLPEPLVGWGVERLASAGATIERTRDLPSAVALVELLACDGLVVDLAADHLGGTFLAQLDARHPVLVLDDEGGARPVSFVLTSHHDGASLPWELAAHTVGLFGPQHALVRHAVRTRRPAALDRAHPGRAERVLVVLGGSDVARLADRLTAAVLASGAAMTVRAVAADDAMRRRLEALPLGAGQRVETVPAGSELAEHLAWADLVLSSASTTMLEACCLGRPCGVVAVVAGQEPFRDWVDAHGIARALDTDDLVASIGALVDDAAVRRALGSTAAATVDGLGAERVANALLAAVHERWTTRPGGTPCR